MTRMCFSVEVGQSGIYYLSQLTEKGAIESDENDYSEHWTEDEEFTDVEDLIIKLRAYIDIANVLYVNT